MVAVALESAEGTAAGTHQRQALDELCRLYWYPVSLHKADVPFEVLAGG